MDSDMTAAGIARIAMRHAERHGQPNRILQDGLELERVRVQAGRLLLQAFLEVRRDDDACAIIRLVAAGEDLHQRGFGYTDDDADALYSLADRLDEMAATIASGWREYADYIQGGRP